MEAEAVGNLGRNPVGGPGGMGFGAAVDRHVDPALDHHAPLHVVSMGRDRHLRPAGRQLEKEHLARPVVVNVDVDPGKVTLGKTPDRLGKRHDYRRVRATGGANFPAAGTGVSHSP